MAGHDREVCEHTFVTSDGSPIKRLRAALRAGDLLRVRGVAAELPYISLPDALLILDLIESQDERRFEPAAVRWAGRLALEAPGLTLAQLHLAVEALNGLPDDEANATLRALALRAGAERESAAGRGRTAAGSVAAETPILVGRDGGAGPSEPGVVGAFLVEVTEVDERPRPGSRRLGGRRDGRAVAVSLTCQRGEVLARVAGARAYEIVRDFDQG